MRGLSIVFLSLLAATNAAVMLPRQGGSTTALPPTPMFTPTLSASTSAASSSTTSSSSSSASSSTTGTPTTTIPYVEPTSTAIGLDAVGQANANETDESSNARCTRTTFQVPVNVTQPSYDTVKLGVEPQVNQSRITEIFLEFVTSQQNFTQAYVNGSHSIEQTYSISGIYCEPTNATANGAIQLLVHGIGFDASGYWNVRSTEYNLPEANYSYVYQAHANGYSTFRYDRLGTGQSDRPADGYNEVQANVEVAILENLADRLRNTTDIGNKTWDQTVLVGHSYGSVQSQRLAQLRPELIDALVLTGYSTSTVAFPYFLLAATFTQAGSVFPERYDNISKHWLVTGTESSDQIGFVHLPSWTSNTTSYVRGTAGPTTQGAIFSIPALGAPAENYTGPVQVVLGEKDFIFTFNNPYVNGSDLASLAIEQLFPQAAEGSTGSIIPATGHAINAHITAPLAYNATLAFLDATLFNGTTAGNSTGTGSSSSTTTTTTSVTSATSTGTVTLPTTTTSTATA